MLPGAGIGYPGGVFDIGKGRIIQRWQWQLSTDKTLYQTVTLVPNSIFYRIFRGFNRTFATIVAYSYGHLVSFHFGLGYVLLVETNPFFSTCRFFFSDYAIRSPLGTSSILLFMWHNVCMWYQKLPSLIFSTMSRQGHGGIGIDTKCFECLYQYRSMNLVCSLF